MKTENNFDDGFAQGLVVAAVCFGIFSFGLASILGLSISMTLAATGFYFHYASSREDK